MNHILARYHANTTPCPELQAAAEDAEHNAALWHNTPSRGLAPSDFEGGRERRFVPVDPAYCDEAI